MRQRLSASNLQSSCYENLLDVPMFEATPALQKSTKLMLPVVKLRLLASMQVKPERFKVEVPLKAAVTQVRTRQSLSYLGLQKLHPADHTLQIMYTVFHLATPFSFDASCPALTSTIIRCFCPPCALFHA